MGEEYGGSQVEIEELVKQRLEELADFQKKASADFESMGKVATETKSAIDAVQTDLDALKMQMDRAEEKAAETPRTLVDDFKENESFQRLAKDGRGTAVLQFKDMQELERKATITSSAVGSATSGVLQIDRQGGVVPLARKRLFIRALLNSAPTTMNAIDFVKVSSAPMSPAMQTEGSDKSQSSLHFTTDTANVRTLAHWIPATKQVLADFAGLQAVINDHLLFHYRDIEETQILSGAGTGQNLSGLVTEATSFDTTLLGAAYTKVDQLRRVIQQLETANETAPQWVGLNPVDWADIELTKSMVQAYGGGEYIVGNPIRPIGPTLWGLNVLSTNNLSSGTFLVGNSTGCLIRDREGVTIEISTEHSDYFIKNMVAIRCEGRLALPVMRPASYITGSFTTSP